MQTHCKHSIEILANIFPSRKYYNIKDNKEKGEILYQHIYRI